MKQIKMYRYPHGYFYGGVYSTETSPPVTRSDWQANNFIVVEYD